MTPDARPVIDFAIVQLISILVFRVRRIAFHFVAVAARHVLASVGDVGDLVMASDACDASGRAVRKRRIGIDCDFVFGVIKNYGSEKARAIQDAENARTWRRRAKRCVRKERNQEDTAAQENNGKDCLQNSPRQPISTSSSSSC